MLCMQSVYFRKSALLAPMGTISSLLGLTRDSSGLVIVPGVIPSTDTHFGEPKKG